MLFLCYFFLDFNPDDYCMYRLTLEFSPLGYNTASFTAIGQDKESQVKDLDLGIAFVSIANEVFPAVVLSSKGGERVGVKMEYYSGLWSSGGGFKGGSKGGVMTDSSRQAPSGDGTQQSQACVIL